MKPKLTLLFAALLGSAAFSSLSATEQDPKAIVRFAPPYPGEMRHDRREGAVLVAFTITTQGEVIDPIVVSSTNRGFEAATLAAVKQWKFTPSLRDGVAIRTSAWQLITFMDAAHDVPATTTRLAAKLHVRNSQALVAQMRQPEAYNAIVRIAANEPAVIKP